MSPYNVIYRVNLIISLDIINFHFLLEIILTLNALFMSNYFIPYLHIRSHFPNQSFKYLWLFLKWEDAFVFCSTIVVRNVHVFMQCSFNIHCVLVSYKDNIQVSLSCAHALFILCSSSVIWSLCCKFVQTAFMSCSCRVHVVFLQCSSNVHAAFMSRPEERGVQRIHCSRGHGAQRGPCS